MATQTPEAQAFIQRIQALPQGPGVSLNDALQPSLDDEAQLRRLFATDKSHARLANPYVGLVDVFDAPVDIRTTRARVVKDEADLSAHYVMPLSDANRRAEGSPSIVTDIDEFKKNWGVFSEGSLSQLIDWNNVIAAGGAVLACLTPLSDAAKASKRSMRKYYHNIAYPTSDVDLFLWGLTPEQAEAKIVKIYEAVRDSVPWDVTCVRTKHTISIHSQYPYRSVQIVLRLYSSPAEILAGFDIDAPCCAYDGNRVYANPRAVVAMMRQCNTVDMTRRSPSYEVRLAKYSARAFEVYVPSLARADIDPTIFERSITRVTGLARLLVLEKLTTTDERFTFLENRRTLRGRPNPLNRYNHRRMKRKYKGDLKSEGAAGGLMDLEVNDYDVASLHVPYGPGWDAKRIDKLVYQTDLGMNSTYNPKNEGRRLHRHPAFFGTIEECMEDCCEHCPAPIDDDERKLQADEDEAYVRSRISFIQDDPGRQSLSGSFNPIDVGEWSEQVYIGPTERFFAAIAAQDTAAVSGMLAAGQDPDRRDHVGRTPLHVAILCRGEGVAGVLIDAGARMTARLVDGRTALHLAAQYDLVGVVKKLLARSEVNKEKAKKVGKIEDNEEPTGAVGTGERERMSSEDDWSSADDGDEEDEDEEDDEDEDSEGAPRKPKIVKTESSDQQPGNSGDLPEDATDEPDVFDVNLCDWDFSFTALSHAIVAGSLPVVEVLIAAGADVNLVSLAKGSTTAVLPLAVTLIGEDDEIKCKIAERLITAGASTSVAADNSVTVLHQAVAANKPNLVATFLRCDPNAKTAIDYPVLNYSGGVTPLVTAVHTGNYSVLAVMVAFGVSFKPSDEILQRAFANSKQFSYVTEKKYYSPFETALARHDYVASLLVDMGVEFNVGVRRSLQQHARPEDRRTYLDWTRWAQKEAARMVAELDTQMNVVKPKAAAATASVETLPGWKGFLVKYRADAKAKAAEFTAKNTPVHSPWQVTRREGYLAVKAYFAEMEKALLDVGAKSWPDVYPDIVSTAFEEGLKGRQRLGGAGGGSVPETKYWRMTGHFHHQEQVPEYLNARYDELFEACFAGENKKVEELCLPTNASNADGAEPLQISVSVRAPGGNQYTRSGLTPLAAALLGRRWSTARLVMAIAAAQYQPANNTAKFDTSNINLDDDSDNESDASDDSDGTVEGATINFVDIARRASAVSCQVHPKDLVHAGTEFWEPFSRAIKDNDFENFVNLFSIYEHSPIPVDLPHNLLTQLVDSARVDMLDEFIRRTGSGIRATASSEHAEEEVQAFNDKNKVYLGLNVHGKKRTDLAKRNDPNASQQADEIQIPLVWQAVSNGALAVLDYLLSDRVLAAYNFYAATHSTDAAKLLKRTPDLDAVLPQWLGWAVTPFGESPLSVALTGQKKLETLKYLFKKAPRLMGSALHERVKFLGVNALLIAVQTANEVELVDFLLNKSVSPAERAQMTGWNIFHYISESGRHALLQYFLKKLPRDVVEALLAQQSKGRLNTPLHVAVKKGHKLITQYILEFSKATALVRDVDGSTPLHSAARSGFAEIVQLLVDAAPAGIHMENGVGEAPLEICSLQQLVSEHSSLQANTHRFSNVNELYSINESPAPIDIRRLEKELPKLRITLDGLVTQGTLSESAKATVSMYAFAALMEKKLAAAKAAAAEEAARKAKESKEKLEDAVSRDSCDVPKTVGSLKAVSAASGAGRRELVHLVDVQKSVQNTLESLNQNEEDEYEYSHRRRRFRRVKLYGENKEDDGLEPEEDSDAKQLKGIWIRRFVRSGKDSL